MLTIIGDSHTIALREALPLLDDARRDELKARFGPIDAAMLAVAGEWLRKGFFRTTSTEVAFTDPSVTARFQALTGGQDAIRAAEHRVIGIRAGFSALYLGRWRIWDAYTFDPEAADRRFVSRAVISAVVTERNAPLIAFGRALQERGIRCFFIEPPPLRNLPRWNKLGVLLSDMVVLDKVHRECMASELAKVKVPLIKAPARAYADGLLKAALESERDRNHANARFGLILWQEIARRSKSIGGAGRMTLAAA
jgi:hypothetical protein